MLIKSRNFSPTKCEKTFEKDGFGWAPGQEKKFKGKITPATVKKFCAGLVRVGYFAFL